MDFTPKDVLYVLAFIGQGIGVYVALDRRVTRLEAVGEAEAERLERIEAKLDRLIERDGK